MDPFSADQPPRRRAARKAEFARFHDENYPSLVALLHALRGTRAYAHRASQRAFTDAWLRWQTVRSLPDPAGWTRRTARRVSPPRGHPSPAHAAGHESEWIAPSARVIFDALSELPEAHRTMLALHHVGGLTIEQIADEEHLPIDAVTARLAYAREAFAQQMSQVASDDPNRPEISPSQLEAQALHSWAARELADLAHALSYRSDRRAIDQVFRQAIGRRVRVVAATAAVVSIGGIGGAIAVTQPIAGTSNIVPPPAGGSGMMLPPQAQQPEPRESGPPPVPGAPPVPDAPPPVPNAQPVPDAPAPRNSAASYPAPPSAANGESRDTTLASRDGSSGRSDSSGDQRRDGPNTRSPGSPSNQARPTPGLLQPQLASRAMRSSNPTMNQSSPAMNQSSPAMSRGSASTPERRRLSSDASRQSSTPAADRSQYGERDNGPSRRRGNDDAHSPRPGAANGGRSNDGDDHRDNGQSQMDSRRGGGHSANQANGNGNGNGGSNSNGRSQNGFNGGGRDR